MIDINTLTFLEYSMPDLGVKPGIRRLAFGKRST